MIHVNEPSRDPAPLTDEQKREKWREAIALFGDDMRLVTGVVNNDGVGIGLAAAWAPNGVAGLLIFSPDAAMGFASGLAGVSQSLRGGRHGE